MGSSRAFPYAHLVLGVGTTEVVFGGFIEAVFIVFEQVRELQELMLSILDVSCSTGLEARLEGGVDLQPSGRCQLHTPNDSAKQTSSISSTGVYVRLAMLGVCA